MTDNLALFLMIFTLFIFVFLISHIASTAMQYCLANEVAILEKPAKLETSAFKQKIYFIFSIFPLYLLTSHYAVTAMELIVYWVFITFMVFISIMDFEQHVILDKILLVLILFAFVFSPFLPAYFLNRLVAGMLGGGGLLLLAILTKGGIGGGDIKLLFVLGLWLGSDKLFLTMFFGFISGGIVSAILLLSKLNRLGDPIAYGPYFAISAIVFFLF
ncbi:MAG: peptidase prepilin type [Firmicutes bacterium]|nr:peptidase prepilin type [Bacillota bacterium]